MTEKPLTELAAGEEGVIVALHGGKGLESRLRALGLVEGQSVRVCSCVNWGGPVIVSINRAQVAVGRGMARKILVRAADDE